MVMATDLPGRRKPLTYGKQIHCNNPRLEGKEGRAVKTIFALFLGSSERAALYAVMNEGEVAEDAVHLRLLRRCSPTLSTVVARMPISDATAQ